MNTALRIVSNEAGRKDYINRFSSLEPKHGVLFRDFVTLTVAKKSRRMSGNYGKGYESLVKHLDDFARTNDCDLFTNSINEEFLDDFILYLQDKDLRQTYIKTLINLVKSMVRKAGIYGYAVDPTYNDVEVEDEEPFSIFLSMNDIARIYYYQGLTRYQERIKDLFIVGCLTGLRYSDYSTLTKDNFLGDRIVKVQKKTGNKVSVPIHDFVREIYTKYEGEISKGLTIQYFNRAIKSICRKIGFCDLVTYTYTKGGALKTETKQKWELISSHTARRSCATNLYLTGRLKTYEIMTITGHATEKSFFRYIKISQEEKVNNIAIDNFFKK